MKLLRKIIKNNEETCFEKKSDPSTGRLDNFPLSSSEIVNIGGNYGIFDAINWSPTSAGLERIKH